MVSHCTKVGYKPEVEANQEVDDTPKLETQVGKPRKDAPKKSVNDGLKDKYKASRS